MQTPSAQHTAHLPAVGSFSLRGMDRVVVTVDVSGPGWQAGDQLRVGEQATPEAVRLWASQIGGGIDRLTTAIRVEVVLAWGPNVEHLTIDREYTHGLPSSHAGVVAADALARVGTVSPWCYTDQPAAQGYRPG